MCLMSSGLADGFFTTSTTWEATDKSSCKPSVQSNTFNFVENCVCVCVCVCLFREGCEEELLIDT